MGRAGKFFFAMAWFFFGVMMGFLIAPIKRGVDIDVAIASNNTGDGSEIPRDDDADAPDDDA